MKGIAEFIIGRAHSRGPLAPPIAVGSRRRGYPENSAGGNQHAVLAAANDDYIAGARRG